MRVGLVIYGRLDTLSGGYLYDRQLVNYLRREGVAVEIVSLPGSWYGRHLTHNLSRSFLQQLRQLDVDVLIQDELNHPSLFWLNRRLRRTTNVPIVSIVHHLRCQEEWAAWQRPFYRHIERRYLTTVDGFIFNSQTTRQTVVDLIGDVGPHVVAYPAGDRFHATLAHDEIVARAQQPGPLRLLFVGNLIPRKGLYTLIAALSLLHTEDWRLDVVGNTAVSPPYTQQIQRQITNANLASKITLHGVLPDAQLQTLFVQSHLLTVPSQYEGFGIVYLEGMAFGLPVIASTNGAAHELITQGENGYLVAVGETAVLAQHIQHLIHHRDHLISMSLAAATRFQTQPTWEKSMATITHWLQTIRQAVRA